MKDLKIVNKSLTANTVEKIEFDVAGYEFLVKNFGDYDIYVAFENTNVKADMIKIPKQCGQVCIRNKSIVPSPNNSSKEIYIYTENSGEVEVQCLKF